jgi:hypothetical protein
VLFEERPYKVFQWITGKALTELREERSLNSILLEIGTGKEIAQELISLPGAPTVIRFFWHPRTRFWRRTANRILKLVRQFSTTDFAYALGRASDSGTKATEHDERGSSVGHQGRDHLRQRGRGQS